MSGRKIPWAVRNLFAFDYQICLNACNCYGTVCCDPQSMTSCYLGKNCILQEGTNCFHPLPQMYCYRVTWFFKSILPMHWDRKKMQWLTYWIQITIPMLSAGVAIWHGLQCMSKVGKCVLKSSILGILYIGTNTIVKILIETLNSIWRTRCILYGS